MPNKGDSDSRKYPKYLQTGIVTIIVALIGFCGLVFGPIIQHYAIPSEEPKIEYYFDYEDQVRTNSLANQIDSLTILYLESNDSIEETKICANLSVLIKEESDIMKKYNPNYIPRTNPCLAHPTTIPTMPPPISSVSLIWLLFSILFITGTSCIAYYYLKGQGE
jgi:hypothetical protein